MNPLEQKIESLLFFKNEPVTLSWISKKIDEPIERIKDAVLNMPQFYENRGIQMLIANNSVSLMTAATSSSIIADLSRNQEGKELSKQALETLAIILYKPSVTKSEIDYIRGVNSVFILRNLLVRGLISKEPNKFDKKSPIYRVTHDLLSYLGISSIEDLPGVQDVAKKLQDLQDQHNKEQDRPAEPNEIPINKTEL